MGNSTLLSLATLILAAGLAGWFTRPSQFHVTAAEPVLSSPALLQEAPLPLKELATPLGKGALVIAGGGTLPPSILQKFLDLGGGRDANVVIIPTASSVADAPDVLARMPIWRELHPGAITVFHAETREASCEFDFCRPLENATAVWFVGGDQNLITERYLGTPVEAALNRVLQRGGVIGGTSAGAAIMSRVMIAGGRTTPQLSTGLGFLSGTIVDQHFIKRNRKDRLHAALKAHPDLVGVGIDEETALVCRTNGYEVIGNSCVLMCLGSTGNREALTQTIPSGEKFDLRPWTMAATGRARLGAYSTAENRPVPNLRNGAVVIAGPRPPKAAVQEFLTLAGGKNANVVLVSETQESEKQLREYFVEMGAENLTVCAASDDDALRSPQITKSFAEAQGVWFVGGEEERLLNLAMRTSLQKVVMEVLARGGAVGGSSAGAKIHGDGIVRRKAIASTPSVPADSHDSGLGVLAGVVIDECSFSDETPDSMATVMRDRFPNCIGLGLKESGAVVVRGNRMQVVGSEPVSVYDSAVAVGETNADQQVPAGRIYDFVARRMVEATE